MEPERKTQKILIQVTPETKEKATWLARQSCRSLSAYVRQLLRDCPQKKDAAEAASFLILWDYSPTTAAQRGHSSA